MLNSFDICHYPIADAIQRGLRHGHEGRRQRLQGQGDQTKTDQKADEQARKHREANAAVFLIGMENDRRIFGGRHTRNFSTSLDST